MAYENIAKRMKSGSTREEAANFTSIELVSAADSHCRAFLLKSGYNKVEDAASEVSFELLKTLRHLIELYAIDLCLKNLGDLFRVSLLKYLNVLSLIFLIQFVNISNEDVADLQSRLEIVLSNIRPNAVGLVDGFDIPDRVLGSTLGSYDGNVYERLYEEALKSPLNQEPVNKSFHAYLKPFMDSKL